MFAVRWGTSTRPKSRRNQSSLAVGNQFEKCRFLFLKEISYLISWWKWIWIWWDRSSGRHAFLLLLLSFILLVIQYWSYTSFSCISASVINECIVWSGIFLPSESIFIRACSCSFRDNVVYLPWWIIIWTQLEKFSCLFNFRPFRVFQLTR